MIAAWFLSLCLLALLCAPSSSQPASRAVADGNVYSTITFAADDTARLYVNGVQKAATRNAGAFRTVRMNLAVGDVVAISAKDLGSGYGVVASIARGPDELYRTGVDKFRARRWFKNATAPLAWTQPAFDACDWPRAPNSLTSASVGKPMPFPRALRGARYVWARDAEEKATVFVRFRIGGDVCTGTFFKVVYAADDSAKLFVNGKLVDRVTSATVVGSTSVKLAVGDVVALQARDAGGGYGARMALMSGMTKFLSGTSAEFRVSKWFAQPAPNAWMMPEFAPCAWPRAHEIADGGSIGKPARFPRGASGSKYVWSDLGGEKSTMFLRYRIGGETACTGSFYKVKFVARGIVSMSVNGQLTTTSNGPSKVGYSIVQLKRGDVVSFLVHNYDSMEDGINIGIVGNGNKYLTGVADFRATKRFPQPGMWNAWTRPDYEGACDWNKAVKTTGTPVLPVVPKLPWPLRESKYVWAAGTSMEKSIFVRFRIGGEVC